MNPELTNHSAKLVGNPHILINLVSRRVRQLNSAGGTGSRPLITETVGMGMADIAMTELLEDKMSWELQEDNPLLAYTDNKGKAKKKR